MNQLYITLIALLFSLSAMADYKFQVTDNSRTYDMVNIMKNGTMTIEPDGRLVIISGSSAVITKEAFNKAGVSAVELSQLIRKNSVDNNLNTLAVYYDVEFEELKIRFNSVYQAQKP